MTIIVLTIRTEGKPEKPPNSGYSLYSKKLLASSSLKHLESKERMTEISRMWKELKDEERKLYNEEAQQVIMAFYYLLLQQSIISTFMNLIKMWSRFQCKLVQIDRILRWFSRIIFLILRIF